MYISDEFQRNCRYSLPTRIRSDKPERMGILPHIGFLFWILFGIKVTWGWSFKTHWRSWFRYYRTLPPSCSLLPFIHPDQSLSLLSSVPATHQELVHPIRSILVNLLNKSGKHGALSNFQKKTIFRHLGLLEGRLTRVQSSVNSTQIHVTLKHSSSYIALLLHVLRDSIHAIGITRSHRHCGSILYTIAVTHLYCFLRFGCVSKCSRRCSEPTQS